MNGRIGIRQLPASGNGSAVSGNCKGRIGEHASRIHAAYAFLAQDSGAANGRQAYGQFLSMYYAHAFGTGHGAGTEWPRQEQHIKRGTLFLAGTEKSENLIKLLKGKALVGAPAIASEGEAVAILRDPNVNALLHAHVGAERAELALIRRKMAEFTKLGRVAGAVQRSPESSEMTGILGIELYKLGMDSFMRNKAPASEILAHVEKHNAWASLKIAALELAEVIEHTVSDVLGVAHNVREF